MKLISLRAMLLGCGLLCHLSSAQPGPANPVLDGDWEGVLVFQGAEYHMVLHMNTTPEGKMTALLDHTDHQKISGIPAIGSSFDGSHLILRFNDWKPNSDRDLERKVASYEATVNPSNSEMTGAWTQDGAWPVNFKRLTLAPKKTVPARTTDTPKKVGADELMRIVAAARSMPDADLAKVFTGVELTDRLSGTRLGDLTSGLPGDKSRQMLMVIADQSIFLPPPADEMPVDAAPTAASVQEMLVKVVNYVNATVRQLPNLRATRFSNGFEDQPGEDRLDRLGFETVFYLPLRWVGSLKTEVTYRDRQEMEDKSVKVEKKGNGVGGLITAGEFGPVLSTVLADALKGKLAWTRWEKASDGTMAVFHYQVPEDKSNYHVRFCCILGGYDQDGLPEMQLWNERPAYHGDIVFNPADGSIRLLTLEADVPAGEVVSGAGMAIEYAATDIAGRSYICPVRSVSMLRAHTTQQNGAISGSNYKGPVKTFLNDVRFSDYHRFGSATKVVY